MQASKYSCHFSSQSLLKCYLPPSSKSHVNPLRSLAKINSYERTSKQQWLKSYCLHWLSSFPLVFPSFPSLATHLFYFLSLLNLWPPSTPPTLVRTPQLTLFAHILAATFLIVICSYWFELKSKTVNILVIKVFSLINISTYYFCSIYTVSIMSINFLS